MKLFRQIARDSGPIGRALLRSRAGPVLIALQCAITLAILTNAIFIIQDRLQKMARPSGVDVDNVMTIRAIPFKAGFNLKDDIALDLVALRAIPGVVEADVIASLPLSGGGSSTGIRPNTSIPDKDSTEVGYYEGGARTLQALGLKLVEGRGFNEEEVKAVPANTRSEPAVVILSKALADQLFPDGHALGKPVYGGDNKPIPVVGIVEKLQTPWINWGKLENAMLISQYTLDPSYMQYVIRTAPGERARVMAQVESTLLKRDPNRILSKLRTQTQIEAKAYASYRAMAIILSAVIVLIVVVTALGILGLASFNVNARKKQIGTRRALGASAGDILRYFQVESLLITSAGALLGVLLSFGLSVWMVSTFSLPRLDWRFIPVGVVFLWLLGQLAVLVPARRAAALPPALATRSV